MITYRPQRSSPELPHFWCILGGWRVPITHSLRTHYHHVHNACARQPPKQFTMSLTGLLTTTSTIQPSHRVLQRLHSRLLPLDRSTLNPLISSCNSRSRTSFNSSLRYIKPDHNVEHSQRVPSRAANCSAVSRAFAAWSHPSVDVSYQRVPKEKQSVLTSTKHSQCRVGRRRREEEEGR